MMEIRDSTISPNYKQTGKEGYISEGLCSRTEIHHTQRVIAPVMHQADGAQDDQTGTQCLIAGGTPGTAHNKQQRRFSHPYQGNPVAIELYGHRKREV